MDRFVEQLKAFFGPLNTAQRLLFGLLSVVVLGILSMLFFWASRPDYALLFGSLNPDSAQEIVSELKDQGVDYQLEQNGSAIMVPRSQVYDLRLQYASQGMKSSEYKGYELFDSSTLGMTDFMQRVNMKRALEGELARTINALAQVEFSRVHLVLPERSPFEESNVEATASVILTVAPGQQLSTPQIDGISSLVAGSVEKLSKDKVTIIDQKGNKISNNEMMDEALAASNAQMKHQKSVESYLMNKAQSMLDRVVGAGNAIVRVSTKHDFEKLKRESRLIDPDSRIVISEEKQTQSTNNTQGQPIEYDDYTPPAMRGQTITTETDNNQSTNYTRNYEVNTTQQTYEKPLGNVQRMTASVLLNHKRQVLEGANGQDSVAFQRYTNQELNEIRDVVSAAIGLDLGRGDQLSINQVRFDNSVENYMQEQQQLYQEQQRYNELIRWGVILLAVLGSMAIIYAILRRMFPSMSPPFFMQKEVEGRGQEEEGKRKQFPKQREEGKGAQAGEDGMVDDEAYETELEKVTDMYRRKLSPEAQRRLKMKSKMFEEIKNFAEFKSDEAANLIRSMLVQNKEN
ncbi:MAG: flagellar basal-body MS-ring/collar protein FliF [Bacteroidota bacterium]